jgi:heme-degrading monooxygenase HmoA
VLGGAPSSHGAIGRWSEPSHRAEHSGFAAMEDAMPAGTQATISPDAGCVTLINVFTVKAEDQDELVTMLVEATKKTMSTLPGFISASIHRSLDGQRVTNYAQWRSAADFEAMLKMPGAREHMAPIQKLATNDAHLYSVADVYRV